MYAFVFGETVDDAYLKGSERLGCRGKAAEVGVVGEGEEEGIVFGCQLHHQGVAPTVAQSGGEADLLECRL